MRHGVARWSVQWRVGTIACAVCLWPQVSWAVVAGGFESTHFGNNPIPIGAGARAMGMGGAFVAIADDGTANTWNPAGMSQLEAPELGVSCGYYRRTSQRDGGTEHEDGVDIDHLSYVHPFHAFGFQQTVGIAWQRQYDFTYGQSFGEDRRTGAGAVVVNNRIAADIDQRGAFSSLSASYAIEVAPRLSFGLTGHAWADALTQNSNSRKDYFYSEDVTTTFNGQPLFHVITEVSSSDRVEVERGYSVGLGVMWQPAPALTVAATWKPGYTLHLINRQQIDEVERNIGQGTTTISPTVVSESSSTMHFPTAVALGGAWRWNDMQTISTDATWTRWREFTVTSGGTTVSPINLFVPPADYSDGYAVRLGYEHIIVSPWAMFVPRCGVLYEGLPAVTEAASLGTASQVSATTDHYYGATLGLSVFRRTFIYDVATQMRYGHQVGAGSEAPPDQSANVTNWTVRAALTVQF